MHHGILLDIGSDVLVIYNGEDYIYIPLIHVQRMLENVEDPPIAVPSNEYPMDYLHTLSLRSILNNAKGMFSEIQVTKHQSVHGYVTTILNDYFVFYSPVYKTMYIPINHLKWLIPYTSSQTPYNLENDIFPVNPTPLTLARTFELQLEKLIGKIVVFDLGTDPDRIGQLKGIHGNFVELVTAKGDIVFSHLEHIKTVHYPS
jgi:hypothetical protein